MSCKYVKLESVITEIHKYFVEEIDKTPVAVDEDGDEIYTDMATVNSLLVCNKTLSKRIKELPSVEINRVITRITNEGIIQEKEALADKDDPGDPYYYSHHPTDNIYAR